MNQTVESVSSSLFREYLYRNNYRSTLEAFDREVPRTNESITNRLELAKILHILKLIKANKHREKPYSSMAEMIVADLMSKASLRNPEICIEEQKHSGEVNSDGLVIKGTFSVAKSDLRHERKKKCGDPKVIGHGHHASNSSINSPASMDKISSTSFSKARLLRSGHLKHVTKTKPLREQDALLVVGNSQKVNESNQYIPARPLSRQRNSYNEFESLLEDSESPGVSGTNNLIMEDNSVFKSSKQSEDLEFIDIEGEIDVEVQNLSLNSKQHPQGHIRRAILENLTINEAINLREIIFGNANGTSFNPEWEQQSFIFNDKPQLEFGLVQHKGGPCGILAAVQASVIKHLVENCGGNLSPSNAERQTVLVKVLAAILWQAANYAGGCKSAIVCSDSGRAKFHSSILYRNDGITEKIQVTRCQSLGATESCIKEFLPQFQNSMGKGCILFLYSVVLSRGISTVKVDMDEPGSVLMANHGYCSQELVNLMTMGYAAQNVFNNVIDLDGKILKGAREARDIGFLTLYEYYKVFEVGSYLKNPTSGVWVICSESHYSVLFSKNGCCNPHETTNLYYYDSLGNQDSLYKLSVYPDSGVQSNDDDPPLELCIRTRWKNAKVDWNGAEPLL